MDEMQEALSELYKRRRNLAEQISTEFGDNDVFENVERYDALMKELDSVIEQIKDFHNDGY